MDSGKIFGHEKWLYKLVKDFQRDEEQNWNIDKLPYNDNYIRMMSVHIRQDLFVVVGQLKTVSRQLQIGVYLLAAILCSLLYSIFRH